MTTALTPNWRGDAYYDLPPGVQAVIEVRAALRARARGDATGERWAWAAASNRFTIALLGHLVVQVVGVVR